MTSGMRPSGGMPFCDAMNPAVGNTASVGTGGTMVSIRAARNMPSYRCPPRISAIHARNSSNGSMLCGPCASLTTFPIPEWDNLLYMERTS